MAIYPVQIPNRSTLYVEGTKSAIEAKLKSLGYKKYTITNPISKTKLVTNRLGKGKVGSIKPIKVGSIPAPSARTAGLGKGASGPNNPGMKPDLEARSKLPDAVQKKKDEEAAKRKKQQSNKRGGSGNQTKKNVKPPVNKKTVGNQQKIKDLAKKVKARMPNVSMSKILDTIRTQIRKRPLTAVAGATGVGVAIGTILSALKPTKVADATLTGNKLQVTNTKGGQKSKTKSKTPTKTKKPANPKVAITIATPLPRPKRDNGKKKKDKGGSGMMLSLIVGGKGTAAQRMKEIKAEKELEKKLGGRPTKKQLIAYLKKKN
tara:strand:+ start:531 stop:1484 length:954 start_codon:yes stop_codon:yes gene_type:complete